MDTTLELFEARAALKDQISELQQTVKRIDSELQERYLDRARSALAANGKDFGTITLNDGNMSVKATVVKKVEWDQERLAAVFDQMNPEDARHYAKLSFAVEERKYTAAPPEVRRMLEPCRTTSVGRFTVELKD